MNILVANHAAKDRARGWRKDVLIYLADSAIMKRVRADLAPISKVSGDAIIAPPRAPLSDQSST